MGALFIQTAIADDRIQSAAQPPWETIELDTFIRHPPLLLTPYAETVRFSDYLRQGGESVRYYHLSAYGRGLTLSLSPSSQGRLISGIYETREITLARQPRSIPEALQSADRVSGKPLSLMQASHIVLDLDGGGRLIYRLNCLEAFRDHIALSGSLRIPQLLLHGRPEAGHFAHLIHQHLRANEPLFSPSPSRTVDAAVCLDIDWAFLRPARVVLHVAGTQKIALPLLGEPMVI